MTKSYELTTGMELLEPVNTELAQVIHDIRTNAATLDFLAEQIRDAASQTDKAANNAVEGALITGALLTEAKKQVAHGEWENWLMANCQLAARTARAYMQLAKKVPSLDDSNRQRVAVLPLREALKAIATDPTPKPAYSSTYRPARTDREKTQAVFSKAVSVLKISSKAIDVGMKEKQVNDLRKKLHEVLAELDRLEAAAKEDAEVGND